MTAAPGAPRATVIGAGVIGVCCALELQRDGWRVTVVDPDAPGEGCSFGNAGVIGDAFVDPVAMPGALRAVPGWLLDPLGPLALRPAYAPRLLPWLLRFLAAARPARVEALSRALQALVADAPARWRALLAEAEAPGLLRDTAPLWLYREPAAHRADRGIWALRERRGSRFRPMDRRELADLEPALATAVPAAAYLLEGCAWMDDPQGAVAALADLVTARGGCFARGTVRAAAEGDVRVARHHIDHDLLVIAAGAWSGPLARRFGARVPLDSERGYHVTLPRPGVDLGRAVFVGDGRWVATPMRGGLRLAGTVEFAGLKAPPDWRRARVLTTRAQGLLPGLDTEAPAEWMGHRPALPDTVPVVGRAPAADNVLLAFGHGHQGLMAAPTTARLVADLAAGRAADIDPAPYRPERFH